MAWTTPSVRSTGDLITASIWNTDLKDNLRYLKGMDGQITLEDDLIPNSSSLTLGESANPWGEGDFYDLYAGPRFSVHRHIRELVINWEDDTAANYQLGGADNGSGSFDLGGTGQGVFHVDDNVAGNTYRNNEVEQNNAYDTSFNASRSPYYRLEFVISQNVSNTGIFLGLRQTPGTALPLGSAENFAGLVWTGAIWQCQCADGSSAAAGGTETVAANQRHTIEILIISASSVEFWLDGTLVETLSSNLPTGDLDWAILLESDGAGGATTTYLTTGKLTVQESLS